MPMGCRRRVGFCKSDLYVACGCLPILHDRDVGFSMSLLPADLDRIIPGARASHPDHTITNLRSKETHPAGPEGGDSDIGATA